VKILGNLHVHNVPSDRAVHCWQDFSMRLPSPGADEDAKMGCLDQQFVNPATPTVRKPHRV
jgi:hypothetical protein